MKEVRILALASMLALGLSLSAQTKGKTKTTTNDKAMHQMPQATMPAHKAVDYSQNPYWAPQDYNYISVEAGVGS
jgi:hypothetical protein